MDEEPAQIVGMQQPDLATSAVIGVEQRCHGAADRPVRQSADQRRHPDHQGRPPTGRDEVLGLPVQLRVAGGVDRNEQPGARPGRGIGDKHDTGETSRLRHTGFDRGEVDDGVGGVREINQGRCVQRSVHRLHPRVEIAALGLCDTCHVVPCCDQMPGRQAAELTGGTGDQYSHRPRLRSPWERIGRPDRFCGSFRNQGLEALHQRRRAVCVDADLCPGRVAGLADHQCRGTVRVGDRRPVRGHRPGCVPPGTPCRAGRSRSNEAVQVSSVPTPSKSAIARRVGSRSTASWTSSHRKFAGGGSALYTPKAVLGEVAAVGRDQAAGARGLDQFLGHGRDGVHDVVVPRTAREGQAARDRQGPRRGLRSQIPISAAATCTADGKHE